MNWSMSHGDYDLKLFRPTHHTKNRLLWVNEEAVVGPGSDGKGKRYSRIIKG